MEPHSALRNKSSLLVLGIDLPNLSFWTLLDRPRYRRQQVTHCAGAEETGAVRETENSASLSEPDGCTQAGWSLDYAAVNAAMQIPVWLSEHGRYPPGGLHLISRRTCHLKPDALGPRPELIGTQDDRLTRGVDHKGNPTSPCSADLTAAGLARWRHRVPPSASQHLALLLSLTKCPEESTRSWSCSVIAAPISEGVMLDGFRVGMGGR